MPLRLTSSSPDLLTADKVLFYLSFLDAVDRLPCLYFNSAVLHNAIRRYEHHWLPLLYSTSDTDRPHMVPPLDVAWVWVCHMLSPRQYRTDLESILSKHRSGLNGDAGHTPSVSKSSAESGGGGGGGGDSVNLYSPGIDRANRRAGASKTAKRWHAAYPNEPYDLTSKLARQPLYDARRSAAYEAGSLGLTLESAVISTASNGLDFHYQVCTLPHFRDADLLRSAISKYATFVKLLYKSPESRLCPPLDVELVWRVHMLHHGQFMTDYAKRRAAVPTALPSGSYRSDGWMRGHYNLKRLWPSTSVPFGLNTAASATGAVCMLWRGNMSFRERYVRTEVIAGIKALQPVLKTAVEQWQDYVFECDERSMGHKKPDVLRVVTDGGRISPTLAGRNPVKWVHNSAIREAERTSPRSARVLTRRSYVRDPAGRRLLTVLTHIIVHPVSGEPDLPPALLPTIIELFEIDNSEDDDEVYYMPLPLATAHSVQADDAWTRRDLERERGKSGSGVNSEPQEKKPMFVLRVGGNDVGLLAGVFRKGSKRAASSTAGAGGTAGVGLSGLGNEAPKGINAPSDVAGGLHLRYYDVQGWHDEANRSLPTKKTGYSLFTINPASSTASIMSAPVTSMSSLTLEDETDDMETPCPNPAAPVPPPRWATLAPNTEDNRRRGSYDLGGMVRFDLATARMSVAQRRSGRGKQQNSGTGQTNDMQQQGSDILRAALVSLSAAALYAQLQPRSRPTCDDDGYMTTMYPPFTAQQGQFDLVRAAGGERIVNGQRMGAAELMRRMSANRLYVWGENGEDMDGKDVEYAAHK